MNATKFNTRNELLKSLPQNLIFCEIGVFRGEFAKNILAVNQPKELWLVDIWEGKWGSGDKDGNHHTEIDDMEKVYLNLYQQAKLKPNIHVIRAKSVSFLQSCQDEYFDAIYVDGDHTAQAVYTDLVTSFAKVKNNGYLMGHDYHYTIGGEVAYAVNKFCSNYKQTITAIADDGCPSFLMQIKK